MTTKIEWTRGADGSPGMTWNPTLGCSKVGDPDEGECSRCYAITVAGREMSESHKGLTVKRPGERLDWSGVVRTLPERLEIPTKRKKPTTWFVDSMSDLFHPDVPTAFISQVFDVMERCPHHTFQILTKRPQRMAKVVHQFRTFGNGQGWFWDQTGDDVGEQMRFPNVWCGASIGEDKFAFRANHVRLTPTVVPWLSIEPLLTPLPSLNLAGISWAVVGGESGPGARRMDLGWVRDIRDRCADAGVALFVKQLGRVWAQENGSLDMKGGYWTDWPEDLRIREMPNRS